MGTRIILFALVCTLGAGLLAVPAGAKVYVTVPEFLERMKAAPSVVSGKGEPCRLEKETHYLTEPQKQQVRTGWNRPTDEMKSLSGLWIRYRVGCPGAETRFIYFDSHRVRTQGETLAFVVRAGGVMDRVEVLSFDEPEDYVPRDKWFGTFSSRKLNPSLELQRDIPMITGATLSARAAVVSARKVLAVHSVLEAP
jgi:hypothetical protein